MKKNILIFLSIYLLIFSAKVTFANSIKTVNLNELVKIVNVYEGKKIVILNFFATWCPPCREEIPGLISITKERSNDVVILGLSVDENIDILPRFINSFKINYRVLRADKDIQRFFKINAIPHNAIINKKGELVFSEGMFKSKQELNEMIDKLLGK